MKIDNLHSNNPQIQNCLVLPWYPNFGHWPQDYIGDYIGDHVAPTDIDPYFGRATTSPTTNSETFYIPAPTCKFDKQVWFKESDGSYKFILEVPGYGREHLSVEIEGDTLVIEAEKFVGENFGHCFTERYVVPDSSLDLGTGSVKVEHGILTIFFPALPAPKPQTIKLL